MLFHSLLEIAEFLKGRFDWMENARGKRQLDMKN